MYGDVDVTGFIMLCKKEVNFDKKDRWQIEKF